MTQLIINGQELPELRFDKYSAHPVPQAKTVTMASGRTVQEVYGSVWEIEAEYDYLGNTATRQLLGSLRGGNIEVSFIGDTSADIVTARFFCKSLTPPTCAWSKNGDLLWHNIKFTLQSLEVIR